MANRWRCDWRALAAEFHATLRSPFELAPIALAALTFGVLFVRQQLDPLSSPHSSWNYIADVFAMFEAHGLPASTLHYGVPMDFETNKLAWYGWLGQWFAVAGTIGDPRSAIVWVAPATAGAAALALGCLARMLTTSARISALATGLALCMPRLIGKLAGLRGEAAGIALLFALLWAVHRSLRERGQAFPLLAATAAACLAMVHLVPAAVAILYGATLVPVWFAFRGTQAGPGLARAAGAALLAVAAVTVVWLAVPSSPLSSQSAISQPAELEPYKGRDPSHAFLQLVTSGEIGRTTAPYLAPEPRSFLYSPGFIGEELVARTALPHPFWPERSIPALIVISLLAGALGMARRREPGSDLLVQLPLITLALYGLGLYFSWRYSTYLPARHPFRREFMYLGIFHALAAGVALDALRSWLYARFEGRRAAVWTAVGIAAVAVPVAIGGASELKEPRALGRSTASGERTIEWLCANARSDAPLLFDGSTVGLFAAHCRLSAVGEGRAAYFQPLNLRTALEALEGARRFFRIQDRAFLREHGVEFIVTGSEALGTRAFAEQPLRLDPSRYPIVAIFGEVVVHRVPDATRVTPE